MAEIGAAALAYEAVETTAQVGVAAYMVAKPTVPLKATFTQIATTSDDSTKLSLTRSGHSISVVKNRAYIFGGETATGKLASTDVHAFKVEDQDTTETDYAVIPPIADTKDGPLPLARKEHAACSFNICVAIFGGADEAGSVLDDQTLWLFNVGKSTWETLNPANSESARPQPRQKASLFDHRNNLVLFGGSSADGKSLRDVWYFSYVKKMWERLPDVPVATTSVALSDDTLSALSASKDGLSGDLYTLSLTYTSPEEQVWTHKPFPANPLAPGPAPRIGAGLVPISTGYGRQYLLYMFGSRDQTKDTASEVIDAAHGSPEKVPQFCSDMWTYQMPSSNHEAKVTTNVLETLKPAKIKDSIRGALGFDSGKHSWAEVEVLPPKDLPESGGKVHPGPRAHFACDVSKDGRTAVLWGGLNPRGEREGDGWAIRLE